MCATRRCGCCLRCPTAIPSFVLERILLLHLVIIDQLQRRAIGHGETAFFGIEVQRRLFLLVFLGVLIGGELGIFTVRVGELRRGRVSRSSMLSVEPSYLKLAIVGVAGHVGVGVGPFGSRSVLVAGAGHGGCGGGGDG